MNQLGWLFFPTYGKIKKNVPNHQPVDNPLPKDRRIQVPIQSIDRAFHRFIAERPGQKVWRLRREETTFFSKNDLGGEEFLWRLDAIGDYINQWEISRILKWRYVSTICLAIFCGDIPLHRPYIGLIYGRYLQFRFLKWPLNQYPLVI